MLKRFVCVISLYLLTIVINPLAYAELYQGIGPFSTLGDLKAKYPGATFTKEYPAWAKEDDVMYSITGRGMSGTIIVKFSDQRPFFRKLLETAEDENSRQFYQKLAYRTEDSVSVDWLRWCPDYPFPLTRLLNKYGKPNKSGFSEDSYSPCREWSSRGILASLTDDGKKVICIEFTFTKKEIVDALKAENGSVPGHLQIKDKKKKGEGKVSSKGTIGKEPPALAPSAP